ncbi:lactonase family protein [Galbibacter pacificus]|uniref:Lactonase family protein n=1 Tax=Galbibacter pacificus TaxID=2996052 RepID=A0ABT6FUX8_9FLAO|nr:lactonase family protein [Galbibacter pacificus]MDG3583448.1 lactonase family protein [Galbibacter pacificus]MDG3587075.1 lactonase family protein [Galbibacter pacificus]
MKLSIISLSLLLMIGCKESNQKQETVKVAAETKKQTEPKNIAFYVGTYTNGESEGIYSYSVNRDGKLKNNGLAAMSENPSFLTFSDDKKYLLAVNEIEDAEGQGGVESYKIEADTLKLINKSPSGGAHPCFIVANEANFVLTANYSSGNVGLLQLNSAGALSGILDVHQHTGRGTTERQKGPHAHSVWLQPTQKDVVEVDLGTNELWFTTIDEKNKKLAPKKSAKLAMERGAGPRHMTFHPNGKWAYVFNELNSTITQLSLENETYKIERTISTVPSDFKGENTAADIHITSNGKFLYASNRGHNSIAIFEVGADGSLKSIGFESVKGDGPRNFAISPKEEFLLVANQYTNNIVSFKKNPETGLLTYMDEIDAPSPVCILFK